MLCNDLNQIYTYASDQWCANKRIQNLTALEQHAKPQSTPMLIKLKQESITDAHGPMSIHSTGTCAALFHFFLGGGGGVFGLWFEEK